MPRAWQAGGSHYLCGGLAYGVGVGAAGALFAPCVAIVPKHRTSRNSNRRLIPCARRVTSRRRHGFGVNGFRQGDRHHAQNQTTVAEKNVARAATDAFDASQDLSSIDSELWARYAEEADPKLRDKNIRNERLSTVRAHRSVPGGRIHARLPNEVDVEDLVTAGCFGLMEAADNFDLARGEV